MAVSLPPPKPQEGYKNISGGVASGVNRPQASFLPSVLRDGSDNSPKTTATILAVQARGGKAPDHSNRGVLPGGVSKSGGYDAGLQQGKDTEHSNLSAESPETGNSNNHETSSSVQCGDQKKQGKVKADVQDHAAVPTRPASARKRGKNSLRELRVSVGGKLSKLLGLGGSSGGGDSEPSPRGSPREATAAAPVLPWKPCENLSKTLDYRPRGHGQAFLESYEVGAVLGSGGFAVVLEGGYDSRICVEPLDAIFKLCQRIVPVFLLEG